MNLQLRIKVTLSLFAATLLFMASILTLVSASILKAMSSLDP